VQHASAPPVPETKRPARALRVVRVLMLVAAIQAAIVIGAWQVFAH